jgi:hypothetical protein
MVTAAVLYAEGERVLYAEGERVRARVFVHPSSAGASAARARAADANMLTVNRVKRDLLQCQKRPTTVQTC